MLGVIGSLVDKPNQVTGGSRVKMSSLYPQSGKERSLGVKEVNITFKGYTEPNPTKEVPKKLLLKIHGTVEEQVGEDCDIATLLMEAEMYGNRGKTRIHIAAR